MELQWPLILFTSLLAASAGLFAAQGCYALAGKGDKAQMPALATSLVLLVVGGVAVFFHLQHWDRIFNGFGHLSSGITQELIAIVIMAVVMVVFFAMNRREGGVPKWMGVLAIIAAAALVVVMGHSYMMESRPAWNSVLQVCSLLGAACAFGAGAFALLDGDEGDKGLHATLNAAGSIVNLVCMGGFAAVLAGTSSSVTKVDYTFDPTQPEAGIPDFSGLSPLAGDSLAPFMLAILVGGILPVVFALLGRKSGNWRLYGLLIALCVLVGAIALRVVFYQMGSSVFGYY